MKLIAALATAAALVLPSMASAHPPSGHLPVYYEKVHFHYKGKHYYYYNRYHYYGRGNGYKSFSAKKLDCPKGTMWSKKYKGCMAW